MSKESKAQALIDSLEMLRNAFNCVNENWSQLEMLDTNEILNEQYPFKMCFNETTQDVAKWTNHSIKEIEEMLKANKAVLQQKVEEAKFRRFIQSKVLLPKEVAEELTGCEIHCPEAFVYENNTYIEVTKDNQCMLVLGRCDFWSKNAGEMIDLEKKLYLYTVEEVNDFDLPSNKSASKWIRNIMKLGEDEQYYW